LKENTDREILEMIRKGQAGLNQAFGLLMDQYRERVYFHVRRILIDHDDTDDVVQNTFIKVWQGLETFRAESGFFTWIYRIATNEALNFLKKKRRRYFLPLADVEAQLVQKLDDNYFSGNEIQKELQKAILKLPEKQRIVFNMKYFEEMKYNDISKILGTSEGALKASYHHAVKKIENHMKEL